MDYIETSEDLQLIQELFIKEVESVDDYNYEESSKDILLMLDKYKFANLALSTLRKGTKSQYENLFDLIDQKKEGYIDWEMFISYLLKNLYKVNEDSNISFICNYLKPRMIKSNPHQDIIVKIEYVKVINRFLFISKDGCVSLWNYNLKLLKDNYLPIFFYKAKTIWVTHWTLLKNVNKIAVSFTSREISIYDLNTNLDLNCQFRIEDLPHIPLTMHYWFNSEDNNHAILSWGDTKGFLYAIIFNSVQISLFEQPTNLENKNSCIGIKYNDLVTKQYNYARITSTKCHKDWINQVMFCSNLGCFISCASSDHLPLIINWVDRDINEIQNKTYSSTLSFKSKVEIGKSLSFKILCGIYSFDYNENVNIIATACADNNIYLWNPYVTSKPIGILNGNSASIMNVCFFKDGLNLISYSRDRVIRIWNTQLQICVQKLPHFMTNITKDAKSIMYFDASIKRIFVSINKQIFVFNSSKNQQFVKSHNTACFGAIYDPIKKHVISISYEGTMIIWSLETGQKIKEFHKCHGPNEITSFTVDALHSSIYTSATDGIIKIWNQSGNKFAIKCLECNNDYKITQMIVLNENIYVVGWKRSITEIVFSIHEDISFSLSDWKNHLINNSKLISITSDKTNVLFTGNYSGEIIGWDSSNQLPLFLLNKNITQPVLTEGIYPVFEKNSIFLIRLLMNRKKMCNIITCNSVGFVEFWCETTGNIVAQFMPHENVQNIEMCISDNEEYLATSDIFGFVKIWDISNYCTTNHTDYIITIKPNLLFKSKTNYEAISSVEFINYLGKNIILTSSEDGGVQISDFSGKKLATFGQSNFWLIEKTPEIKLNHSSVSNIIALEDNNNDDILKITLSSSETKDPQFDEINFIEKQFKETLLKKAKRDRPILVEQKLKKEKLAHPLAGAHSALKLSTLDLIPKK